MVGFLLTFFLGLLGAIIVACLASDEEQRERERERDNPSFFYCNICYITYKEDLLAAKLESEGMICKYCMEKRHKEKG